MTFRSCSILMAANLPNLFDFCCCYEFVSEGTVFETKNVQPMRLSFEPLLKYMLQRHINFTCNGTKRIRLTHSI